MTRGGVEEVGSTSKGKEEYTPRRVLTLDAYIVLRQLGVDRHYVSIKVEWPMFWLSLAVLARLLGWQAAYVVAEAADC